MSTTRQKMFIARHKTTQHEATLVQYETISVQHGSTRVKHNIKFILIYLYQIIHCILGSKAPFMFSNLEI